MKPAYRTLVVVWLALLALLALTCASAFVPMGAFNGIANFAVAALKAALVALFFMHLMKGKPLHRLAGLSALFILALLLGLSQSDYVTRAQQPSAWQQPPR